MANFLGGVIPTVKVSSNSTVNSVATGVVEKVTDTAINVALGSVLSDSVGAALGVSPASFDDLLSTAVIPGVISLGQTAINEYITGTIANSEALGPFGPLAANLATSAVQGLTGKLLGNLNGGNTTSPSSRWFPGAGDEPDAFYNGTLFTGGPTGSDVVFSIKSAETVAVSEATKSWFNPGPETLTTQDKLGPGVADLFNSGDSSKLLWAPTASAAGTPDSFKALYVANGVDSPTMYGSGATSEAFQGQNISILPPKESWNFICAPDEISWNSEVQAERAQIFGTNQAPVTAGSKGMRDLNLSNALVEGFSRGKSVENKIAKLESLMNFSLDTSNNYVKVPVFYVTANDKKYGFGLDGKDGGYFVIKSVNVKETMRDLKGDTTRGTVDVSFIQVPPYQVDSGRDIASKSMRGQTSILGAAADKQAAVLKAAAASGQISQDSNGVGGKGSVNSNSGKGTNGASAPASTPASTPGSSPDKRKPTPIGVNVPISTRS